MKVIKEESWPKKLVQICWQIHSVSVWRHRYRELFLRCRLLWCL